MLHSTIQSPCWQHHLSSDNKRQWQWKERNLCSKRNKNHATVKTEVTWFCVDNVACPPHALRQVCEEQSGLGTATPGNQLQITATNVQTAPSGEHPWNNVLTPAQAPGPALLHRMASCPAAARNRCKCKLCLHDVMSGGCATQSSHNLLGVRKRDAEEMCTYEWGTGHLSNSKTLRLE